MIEIALFSDVHGNLPALKTVLNDINSRGINQVYCLGDLVDFAPWGNEVIDVIKQLRIPCLLGNHDERIGFDMPIIPIPHHSTEETLQRIAAINHSKNTITSANKLWLTQLPYNIELHYKLNDNVKKILLVHASTRSNDEYIHVGHDIEDIKQMFVSTGAHVIVMGHTHISQEVNVSLAKDNNGFMLNCGSVGRSREENRLASYAILKISETSISAEIIKLEYPIQEVAQAVYDSDIPNFYGDFLLNTRAKV